MLMVIRPPLHQSNAKRIAVYPVRAHFCERTLSREEWVSLIAAITPIIMYTQPLVRVCRREMATSPRSSITASSLTRFGLRTIPLNNYRVDG